MLNHKKILVKLFAFSWAIRLIFFYFFLSNNPVQLAYDSGHYHTAAVQLAQGNGFAGAAGQPYFYRLPGYPAFLACSYKLFGINPTSALLVQMLLASLIPLLVYLLCLTMFPGRMLLAKISSIVTALHPGFLIMSGLVMSETLFVLMFLLFLNLFLRSIGFDSLSLAHHERPKITDRPERSALKMREVEWVRSAVLSGLLLGLACLVRPVGIPLILVMLGINCFLNSPRLKTCFQLFLGWLIPISVWAVRNFLLTGSIFLSTFNGPHIINHGATRVVMEAEHISYEQAKERVSLETKSCDFSSGRADEVNSSRAQQKLGAQILLSYPFITLKLCLINCLKTVFGLYSSELLFIDSGGQLPRYERRSVKDILKRFLVPEVKNKAIWLVIYAEVLLNLFILIGFFGFIFCMIFTRKDWQQGLLCLSLIALFVALSCLCGFARLRLPIEPFLITLGTCFWLAIFTLKTFKAK